MKVKIYEYKTGDLAGEITITREQHDKYLGAQQLPQTIVSAGEILTGDQIESLSLDRETTIWMDV